MNTQLENFLKKYEADLSQEAISELKIIIQESEYFEKTFTESPCLISLINEDGTFANVNKKMLSILDLELENIIGKKVDKITENKTILKLCEQVKDEDTRGGNHHILETTLDGEKRQFLMTFSKVGNKTLIIASDVTDYKRLEQEKNFSDKMAFLGEMSAFIVHEINNPLMAISMANEIIQMDAVSDKMVKNTEDISLMVDTIVNIIESLKQFSRRGEDKQEEVYLEGIFERSKIILSGKIKKHGVKILQSNLKDIKIKGSEVDFLQILVNLISNAIDAVKNNDDKWIKIDWTGSTLKVLDSGQGIPNQVIPNLFKKFYTSKGHEGNGIGLFLSRELLNKWGFDLIYKLEDGHTSFQWIPNRNLTKYG